MGVPVHDDFDRDAAERILQRAVALGEGDLGAGDGISGRALVEAAEELGLDPAVVLRAMSEEQLGLLRRERAVADRLVGPATVTATRLVTGKAEQVTEQVDAWLRRAGGVRRNRFDTGYATYVRRSDAIAGLQRTVRSITGEEHLGRVNHLTVRVNDVDGASSLVALIADLRVERTVTLAGGATLAGVGSAASGVLAVAGTTWLWLGVPASFAAGAGVLAGRASQMSDVQSALDGVLDRIAAGDAPAGVSGLLGDVGRKLWASRPRTRPDSAGDR